MTYTGIRTKLSRVIPNAFLVMDTQDAEAAVTTTREKLRQSIVNAYSEISPSIADDLDPAEVSVIPASWGYPPRVMVTW